MLFKIKPCMFLVLIFSFVCICFSNIQKTNTSSKATEEIIKFVRTIGNLESNDDHYSFYFPSDVAVDNKSNIFILDSGNSRIQKFDKNGKYLLSIGRKGQGPAEYYWPRSFDIDKEGNLYVLDSMQKKIHVLNTNYEETKSLMVSHVTVNIIRCLSGGGWLLANDYYQEIFDEKSKGVKILNKHDKAGKSVQKYVDVFNYGDKSSSMQCNEIKFDREDDGSAIVSFVYQNRIEKYDFLGNLKWSIKRPLNYTPGPVNKTNTASKNNRENTTKYIRCSEGIAVDKYGRSWVITLNRQLGKNEEVAVGQITIGSKYIKKIMSGNTELKKTDAYKLEVFDKNGKLIFEVPIHHFAQDIRIFNDDLFVLDVDRGMNIYQYKIMQ